MITLMLAGLLLAQVPAPAPQPGCAVVHHVYACTTSTGEFVSVSQAWFKAHKVRTYSGGATVDAFAVAAQPGESIAKPSLKAKFTAIVLYTVAGAVVAILIYSGAGGAIAGGA